MKKLVGIGLAAAISFGALSGCSLLGEKANGFVLYGTEEQVQQIADKNKKEVKEKDMYKMKLTTLEDKKVLVMDKKTGEELIKKELLKKVDKNDDTKAIDKLPAVTAEQGVLFAKEKVENATLDGAKLKYEGNTIIGSGRAYADMFAIVDDATYGNVKGEEKSVGVLKFDKDPSKEFPGKNGVEGAQLVTIKK
ncbi:MULTISPECIES: lipoprotein BA_5634 family protein [Bacillus]|uniref:lipoprotein BA_5634 family protein n=1 Tax=Bacillus TaxID=1386 RepID=UPI000468167A|nr:MULTISPECIES: lipoprotein BA_5634 family protein [Bacillus]MED1411827.1 lipoprotein BA_5634 family protein [Bacillus paramycoides]MED1465316.1 lipoprotein BA_5634 family protein [Bacillus paramycoides]MED1490963.1 lipoprotein BA_5634 family protein [Bacillus paramycoides]